MLERSHKKIISEVGKSAGISAEQINAAIGALEGKQAKQDLSTSLLVNQSEASRLLNCSRWTVRRLTAQGLLKPVSVLGLLRYRRDDVVRFAMGKINND